MGSSNQASSTNSGANSAMTRYNNLYSGGNQPSYVNNANDVSKQFMNNYNTAVGQNTKDYGDISGQYGDLSGSINNLTGAIDARKPTQFTFKSVNPVHGPQLQTAYANLESAGKGYQNFADTGGYSAQDIADLRARGLSPVTAAYANAQANIERAKNIGGGYAPNYIAATAKMTRDQSQQASDATQNVNARLAEDIRSGKLAGLGGLAGVGGTEGGLSLEESGQDLQAQIANQAADLRAQGMSEEAIQAKISEQMQSRGLSLSALQGRTSLYGTTPGMSSTFGNQALESMRSNLMAQGMSNDEADRLIQSMSGNQQQKSGPAWWSYLLKAAPYIAAPFTGGASLMAIPAVNALPDGSSYSGGGDGYYTDPSTDSGM